MIQSITKKDILHAGAIFLAIFALYALTAYPTVATEDAGEFAAVINAFGIAHPSGYPLYVILGKLFTLLIPFGNPAWQANIFSAFCGGLTIAGMYLVIKMLTNKAVIALATSVFFASGGIFWSQAVRAEVYTLNSFLFISLIILAFLYSRDKSAKILMWLSFLFGLSIGNHHLMLMAGVPLAIFIVISNTKLIFDYKIIAKAIILFLLGLSIYLYLPIRASYNPEINWGNPNNSERFWQHVTRASYSADAVDKNMNLVKIESSGSLEKGVNPIVETVQNDVMNFTAKYINVAHKNYTVITVMLAVMGMYFLFRRSRKVGVFFFLLSLFYSVILSHFIGLGIPKNLPMQEFITHPFYIQILMLTLILAGVAIDIIMKKIPAKFTVVLYGGLIAISILAIILQYPIQDQSNNFIAYDIAKEALENLPDGAVLISENNDNTLFPIFYLQKVEKFRPDVKIYIRAPINIYNFFKDYESVKNNNPGKRIFTDFPFAYYPNKTYIYGGTFSEIVPELNLIEQKPKQEKIIRGFENNNLDHFNLYLKGRYYLDIGLTYENNTQKQDEYFQKALKTAPESINILAQLIGNYLVRNYELKRAIPYLQKAHNLMPSEYPISFQLILAYINEEKFTDARTLINSLPQAQIRLIKSELEKLKSMPISANYKNLNRFKIR